MLGNNLDEPLTVWHGITSFPHDYNAQKAIKRAQNRFWIVSGMFSHVDPTHAHNAFKREIGRIANEQTKSKADKPK